MERFWEGVDTLLGPQAASQTAELAPTEMQGFAGMLRGAFWGNSGAPTTVRLGVRPWDTDERWAVMVQGRALGPERFWDWLADQPLCRVPFVMPDFEGQCQQCGPNPCLHGAALTYHWLLRVREVPQFLLLLLNRRGKNHHTNINVQPIVRVPVVLGTNLDRTRRELAAILEAAFKAAGEERDDLFGGGSAAHLDKRS
jgi:hypothetical protein